MRERTLEHELESDVGELPAMPDEHQENVIQMGKLARATVEPGLMRLPVCEVRTAANSEQFVIAVDHPVEGELVFYRKKPTDGWYHEQELVELLHWYGITDRDPYQLQLSSVYVKNVGDEAERNHGWALVKPPGFEWPGPPLRERYAERARELAAWRPPRDPALVYCCLMCGAMLGSALAFMLPAFAASIPFVSVSLVSAVVVSLVMFFATTVAGLAITEP